MSAPDSGRTADDAAPVQEIELLDVFRRAGATDKRHAKLLSELGTVPGAAFMRLISADVIRRASDDTYFVNEFAAAIDHEYGVALERYAFDQNARPELIAFTFRIRALVARMRRRPSRVHHEVIALLDGAWHAAVHEARQAPADAGCALPIATTAYNDAVDRLTQLEQSRGRFHYLTGLIYGTGLFVALPAILTELARTGWSWVAGTPGMIAQVILFAGAGAIVSVVTRLPSIDLSKETKNRILIFSGMSRPIVSVLFAAVVYQIIAHEIVMIGGIRSGEGQNQQVLDALSKVAAFLCGFSERFATDLLARIPLVAGRDKPEATMKSAERVSG